MNLELVKTLGPVIGTGILALLGTWLSVRATRATAVDTQVATFNKTLIDEVGRLRAEAGVRDAENVRLRAKVLDYRAYARECMGHLRAHGLDVPAFEVFDPDSDEP